MKQSLTITAATLLVVGLSACGGDSGSADGGSSDDRIDRLTELFAGAGAPEEEARCVADNLDADTTIEQVEAYMGTALESGDPTDAEGDLDVAVAIGQAVQECDL